MRDRTVKHLGYKCLGPTITVAKIKRFQKDLRDRKFSDWQKVFKILSGETRLKIVWLLIREKELCVCDMADILGTTVSAVSHQLKILRGAGFVETRKDAQTIFYTLSKEGLKELKSLLSEAKKPVITVASF
ncbi:MAG: hypothetical protein BMS9Abin34_446 [Patescibacteria group bacterium]|nr:MAG: hypothetical protein BMS9Abin34_446 [Patescibacteria group bacterium]